MQNTLKIQRARKNVSQAELAEIVKVSRLTIHSIETGKFNPSVQLALKLARYFNVSVEELFQLDDD